MFLKLTKIRAITPIWVKLYFGFPCVAMTWNLLDFKLAKSPCLFCLLVHAVQAVNQT